MQAVGREHQNDEFEFEEETPSVNSRRLGGAALMSYYSNLEYNDKDGARSYKSNATGAPNKNMISEGNSLKDKNRFSKRNNHMNNLMRIYNDEKVKTFDFSYSMKVKTLA